MIDENKLLSEISNLKKNMKSENGDYLSGYFSALSTIEGVIAEKIIINERTKEFPCEIKDTIYWVNNWFKSRLSGTTNDNGISRNRKYRDLFITILDCL